MDASLTANIKNGNGFNANTLKLVAISAMTVDHLTWLFLPGYRIDAVALSLHVIGRLTAPIMMFFMAEGYFHTKNVQKYIFRMFIFAIPSHFAFALMFDKCFIPFQNSVFDQTSVMWTFALGLTALAIDQSKNPELKTWHKYLLVCGCLVAAFCANWSTPAAVSILYMGRNRGNFKKQMLWLIIFIALYTLMYAVFRNLVYGIIQMAVVLAIPLLNKYNGERGEWKGMKWLFYIYYPAHLAILGLVRIYLL
jgi:hypothetical protein